MSETAAGKTERTARRIYVAKDEASPYPGGVTRSWLKVKVPGWTDPEDRWRRVQLDTP